MKKVVPLDVQVHLGPAGFPDRFGMASDLTSRMKQCDGGPAEVRMWAQVLGETWVLAAKEPLPGRNWICWADGLWDKGGGALFAGHGGSKDRLKLLQASQLGVTIRGKGELSVVGGPVTRQAVRLRILFRNEPAIDLEPLEVGPRFPVKFYAVFFLQPAKTAWMPERVVAYNRAGRKIAECWATTRQGDVCDRPAGAPPATMTSAPIILATARRDLLVSGTARCRCRAVRPGRRWRCTPRHPAVSRPRR